MTEAKRAQEIFNLLSQEMPFSKETKEQVAKLMSETTDPGVLARHMDALNDAAIAEKIIYLLSLVKNPERIRDKIGETYCLNCLEPKDKCGGWCDFDGTPLE